MKQEKIVDTVTQIAQKSDTTVLKRTVQWRLAEKGLKDYRPVYKPEITEVITSFSISGVFHKGINFWNFSR